MVTPSWKFRTLLRKAYQRTTERLKYVLLVSLLGGLMTLASLASFGFLVFIASSWVKHNEVVLLILAAFVGIVLLLGFLYILIWTQLAIPYVLISPKIPSPIDAYKNTRPLVNGYIRYSALSGLFGLFLAPADLLISTVLLIRPLSMLWSFWGSFGTFVYLEKQKKGLDNLWTSRAMINQKFWKVAWRLFIAGFIAFLAILVSLIPLVIILVAEEGNVLSTNMMIPFIIFIATFILTIFFTTPFIISYNFEVYKNLSVPKDVQKPREWIWIGVIGIILGIASLAFLPHQYNKSWQQFLNSPPNFTPR